MPDGPTDLLPADLSAAGDLRARIEALVAAARDLSDTCADLADELRPEAGADGSPADRAASLLDEAASAVRATLRPLGAAGAALDARAEPYPTVAIPAQAALGQDPFTAPSPWARAPDPEEDVGAGDADWRGRTGSEDDVAEVLPPPRAVATTWPDAFREPPRSVPEEDLVAAGRMDLYGGAEIGADLDRDEGEGLAAVPAALAGWVVVDPDEAGGEPVALEHRPTGPLPVTPVASVAAAGAGPTMLTVSTDEVPYADDPAPYGEDASTEPRSLTLVPPLPSAEPGDPDELDRSGEPESQDDPVSALPLPVDHPSDPAETIDPSGSAGSAGTAVETVEATDPSEPAGTAEEQPSESEEVTGEPAAADLAPTGPWVPEPAWAPAPVVSDDSWTGRSVWAVDPVPGSSPLGDGLPAYPLDEPDLSYETYETFESYETYEAAHAEQTPTPAEAALPPEPVDDPAAAVVARQVEAARRHLQAALVVANKGEGFGALLTAVEQALTAVTDLARETRGVLPERLADRSFPGEARFLCSAPWQTVELVGREAYGEEAASPAGLARLLRALGYDAESTTSAGGVSGVQVRSEGYAAHVALVEPAGGGRQRWSGALEWTDRSGASRTWAETLGPVELPEDELARRVDELLRRSVGSA